MGTGTVTSINSSLTGLTTSGSLIIANNTSTTLGGTITNNGTITLDNSGNNTFLLINGAVSLKGTGSVVLGGAAAPPMTKPSKAPGTTPVLTSFETISGAQGTSVMALWASPELGHVELQYCGGYAGDQRRQLRLQ